MKPLLLITLLALTSCDSQSAERERRRIEGGADYVAYYASFGHGDQVPVQVLRQKDGTAWFIVGTDTHRWDVFRRFNGEDWEKVAGELPKAVSEVVGGGR